MVLISQINCCVVKKRLTRNRRARTAIQYSNVLAMFLQNWMLNSMGIGGGGPQKTFCDWLFSTSSLIAAKEGLIKDKRKWSRDIDKRKRRINWKYLFKSRSNPLSIIRFEYNTSQNCLNCVLLKLCFDYSMYVVTYLEPPTASQVFCFPS